MSQGVDFRRDNAEVFSDQLITFRFKAEVDGLNARSDLHFPAPIPEGGVPSGAVLIVAVVLAFGIFGTWSYLSAPDDMVAEVVPAIPVDSSDTADTGGEPPAAAETGADAKAAAPQQATTIETKATKPAKPTKETNAARKDDPSPAAVATAPETATKKPEPLAATSNIAASVSRARARSMADTPPDSDGGDVPSRPWTGAGFGLKALRSGCSSTTSGGRGFALP